MAGSEVDDGTTPCISATKQAQGTAEAVLEKETALPNAAPTVHVASSAPTEIGEDSESFFFFDKPRGWPHLLKNLSPYFC